MSTPGYIFVNKEFPDWCKLNILFLLNQKNMYNKLISTLDNLNYNQLKVSKTKVVWGPERTGDGFSSCGMGGSLM